MRMKNAENAYIVSIGVASRRVSKMPAWWGVANKMRRFERRHRGRHPLVRSPIFRQNDPSRGEVPAGSSNLNGLWDKRQPMKTRSTTILSVRYRGSVALGGDGQVSLGNSIVKADTNKIRRLLGGSVMTGFAGSSADAFALLERFEAKLKDYPSNVPRAATELAKDWRTDRVLRRLEALLAVVDAQHTLLVTGNGDVIQPTDGVLGIGSGGNYAVAAARALVSAETDMSAADIVRRSLEIAAAIDVFTNDNILVEEMPCES